MNHGAYFMGRELNPAAAPHLVPFSLKSQGSQIDLRIIGVSTEPGKHPGI